MAAEQQRFTLVLCLYASLAMKILLPETDALSGHQLHVSINVGVNTKADTQLRAC